MVIILNNSKKDVIVEINGQGNHYIPAGQQKECAIILDKASTITLHHPNESYKKRNVAHIMIETTYELPEHKNTARLVISREKTRFDIDGCFDCFFLQCDQETLSLPVYNATGISKLRKKFKIASIIETTMIEPITSFGLHDALFYLTAVGCAAIWGWKYLLAFFLAVYILNLCVGYISEKIVNVVGKAFQNSVVKIEDIQTKLSRWSQSSYIADYYINADRKPVVGDIEH